MAKIVKPLTAVKVRQAKISEKPYKLYDGDGLFLHVSPSGRKTFRFEYSINGRKTSVTIGQYPFVSLEQARKQRMEMRDGILKGNPPGKKVRAGTSFREVAQQWHEVKSHGWSDGHSKRLWRLLEVGIFPYIGHLPIYNIKPVMVLDALKLIQERGKIELAHRTKIACSQVFKFGIAAGLCETDPSQHLSAAMIPVRRKHFASVTSPDEVSDLLKMLWSYKGAFQTETALRIAPYLFVRPGELRKAQWADIDLGKAEWRYHVGKTDTDHIVPLSKQVVNLLSKLKNLTGRGRYVFASDLYANRPMSENTINAAMRRMGISADCMTAHGFRAMARTLLDEALGFRVDLIEHQLAHSVADPLGRAYNRTQFLKERHEMMQKWADYLDALRLRNE